MGLPNYEHPKKCPICDKKVNGFTISPNEAHGWKALCVNEKYVHYLYRGKSYLLIKRLTYRSKITPFEEYAHKFYELIPN